MTYACELVITEAENTNKITLYILGDMPVTCKLEEERVLREELLIFLQQTSKIPKFNAWGFFDINLKLLLSIVACITAHLIVIIQFNE